MRATTLGRATALAPTIALIGLLLACASDSAPTATPTATEAPTASATPPPAVRTPRPAVPASTPLAPGVIVTPMPPQAVDLTASRAAASQLIDAVASGDVDALEALVRYQQIPCDGERSRDGPPYPPCEGEDLATPVSAFPVGVCNAVWHRDARPMLERFVEHAGPLYAVLEGPRFTYEYHGLPVDEATWDVRVIFETDTTGVPRAASALIAGGRVELLILGCGDPNLEVAAFEEDPPALVLTGPGFVEPTPLPQHTPVPVEAVTAPRGDRTGFAEVDRVLTAIEQRDHEAIRALLQATPRLCSFGRGFGLARCEGGEIEGDLVEVFSTAGGCHGSVIRPDFATIATSLTSEDVELYAVGGVPNDPDRHRLLYVSTVDDRAGFTLSVHGGAIVGTGAYVCSTSPEQHAGWLDIILRGPAWPEDTPAAEGAATSE